MSALSVPFRCWLASAPRRAGALLAGLAVVAMPAAIGTPTAGDLPAMSALDGQVHDWNDLSRKTVLLVFFSPRMPDADEFLAAVASVHRERRGANLVVLGVATDGRKDDLRALARRHDAALPIVLDRDGVLRAALRPSSLPQAFVFLEGQRYLGSVPGYPASGTPDRQRLYANLLRRSVGLPERLPNDPLRKLRPELPDFTATAADGRSLSRDSLLGNPYLLAFVAADCPHCAEQLDFFRSLQAEFSNQGLSIVAVLLGDNVEARAFARERKLAFPVVADENGSLRRALAYRGSVPDTYVVDDEGRVRFRHTAFDDEQRLLIRMELRLLLGLPNPPLLETGGPSGVRRCLICHERPYWQWRLTGHAQAMRSLQAMGRGEDPECVRCHVVGWGSPGGFDDPGEGRSHLLFDVQCESCHGSGGPHVVRPGKRAPAPVSTCAACHDAEHSLHFQAQTALPLVTHALETTLDGIESAAAARERLKQLLLRPAGLPVGSAACAPCHRSQDTRWKASAHAGEDCESCHGPGQHHVQALSDDEARSTIQGLGNKCPECVLQQICTTCHDDARDPGFDLSQALPEVRVMCRGR